MGNILKKLIKIKTNLSLCLVKFISNKDVLINLDGDMVQASINIDGDVSWTKESADVEPIESALLECVITPYIFKLLDISDDIDNELINEEFSLEDIRNMYIEKHKFAII